MKILRYSSALLALILIACPDPSIQPTPQTPCTLPAPSKLQTPSTPSSPQKDLNTLRAAGNKFPGYIWSDGTTMWVTDWVADWMAPTLRVDKLYAYSMSTKARDSAKDFDTLLAVWNRAPSGIWSDGTTMWVADYDNDKLYAYSMNTKQHDSSKDFNTIDGGWKNLNNNPTGMWSDGTTMWVADSRDAKLYAYSMSTKAHDDAKQFNTLKDAGNTKPRGIWSDGTTMWVVDDDISGSDDKLYAYSMSTKERDSAKDFTTLHAAGNSDPRGIWSDGTTMWVVDWKDAKLYAYSMSTKERDSAKDFPKKRTP